MLGGFLRTFPSSCLCGPPEDAHLGLIAVGDGLALALCRAYTAQKQGLEFLSFDIPWQCPTLRHQVVSERGIVFLDKLV